MRFVRLARYFLRFDRRGNFEFYLHVAARIEHFQRLGRLFRRRRVVGRRCGRRCRRFDNFQFHRFEFRRPSITTLPSVNVEEFEREVLPLTQENAS